MAESDNLKRSGDDLESEQSKKSRTDDSGSFDDVKLTMRVLIDDEQVGALIGKGGQIIKKLRGDTSCRIEIDTTVPDARDRVVTVQGPVPKLPLALSLLANRLKTPPGERERDRGDINVKKKLVLPFWWIMLLLAVSLESVVLRSPKPAVLQVQASESPRTPWRTHLKKQLKFVELQSE
jgi:hypothetical protein